MPFLRLASVSPNRRPSRQVFPAKDATEFSQRSAVHLAVAERKPRARGRSQRPHVFFRRGQFHSWIGTWPINYSNERERHVYTLHTTRYTYLHNYCVSCFRLTLVTRLCDFRLYKRCGQHAENGRAWMCTKRTAEECENGRMVCGTDAERVYDFGFVNGCYRWNSIVWKIC